MASRREANSCSLVDHTLSIWLGIQFRQPYGSLPAILSFTRCEAFIVEEVSQKKIPITYNIFFCDTSSTSVGK